MESAIRAASPEVTALLPRPAEEMSLAAVQYCCPVRLPCRTMAVSYHRCYEKLREALDAITPALEAQPLETFYLDLTGLRQFQEAEPNAVAAAIRQVLSSPIFRAGGNRDRAVYGVGCGSPRHTYPHAGGG